MLGLALTAPACGGETGIVLEVSMSPALVTALDASGEDFDTLRIWVGHATEDPSFFAASGDAFFDTGRTRAGLTVPFRYLLEPTGELAAIGPMVFAAAVGDDPDDARLAFRVTGFAVADDPMGFGDDEMRVVTLALAPPDGVVGSIDDGCITWAADTQEPSRITPMDDLDCDGAVGTADCDDADPSQNNLDRDGDQISSCDGDCMDDPLFETPWLDPAHVFPGAPDPGETDPDACSHVDFDCDGNCGGLELDADASGSTACGVAAAEGGFCPVVPADCDESRAGQQPLAGAAPEACNARDDACDGFLPPKLPCLIDDGTACRWGEVECDETEGEYRGENDALQCKALADGFSDDPAPTSVCDATVPESCFESGDPIGCGFSELGTPRADCAVTSTSQCSPDRTGLVFPGLPQQGCQWLILGGPQQAEWEVGFVAADAPPDAEPQRTIEECAPHLAARSRVANPSSRTVLLLVRSPDNAAFGVRPMVVKLTAGGGGDPCVGVLACQLAGGG